MNIKKLEGYTEAVEQWQKGFSILCVSSKNSSLPLIHVTYNDPYRDDLPVDDRTYYVIDTRNERGNEMISVESQSQDQEIACIGCLIQVIEYFKLNQIQESRIVQYLSDKYGPIQFK